MATGTIEWREMQSLPKDIECVTIWDDDMSPGYEILYQARVKDGRIYDPDGVEITGASFWTDAVNTPYEEE